ncbi:TetR/AcrR family transcriptional regulator [Niallia sp. 03133]|uniref:TetR/AcrR family transcriptional regulator n=1 Tax=Niallia sp. 03133 TaxID=3458060 RepID=UPI004043D412
MSPRAGIVLEDIIRAAVEIADKQGLQEVTMANLAKRLNIKSPSLYNHINGLSELFNRLTLLGGESLYAELKQAAEGLEKEESIHSLGKAYIAFSRKHPGLYDLTLQAPDPEQTELVAISDKIIALLVDVLQDYDLDERASIHAIRGFRSILHGFASIELKNGFGIPLDIDKSFRLLIDTFLAGIEKMKG